MCNVKGEFQGHLMLFCLVVELICNYWWTTCSLRQICTLTLASELALLSRGEPEGCGRALTNPLDSQPNTPAWPWL